MILYCFERAQAEVEGSGMAKADKALHELVEWRGTSEIDFYPYVKDFFSNVLGYPKKKVRLTEKTSQGKIPDVSLVSADSDPKKNLFWVVCEVKKEPNAFLSKKYVQERWENQLSKYITADTVYALFLDPSSLVVLRPDGSIIKSIKLDNATSEDLISSSTENSLSMILYQNSLSEKSLESFKQGLSPSRFFNVKNDLDKKRFYNALRISTRELIDFSLLRLDYLQNQYKKYLDELDTINQKVGSFKDEAVLNAKESLAQKYKDSLYFFKTVLPEFEAQVGRQIPSKEKDAQKFIKTLYATEGSSLYLARILFVRFLEDNDMVIKKISNGGIKAYRDYHRYIKDDYQFLLTDAFKEAEYLYNRLFQPSIFDWSHEGDGELSKLLLRIFYRLNAFDFANITGDILGNLYERFLGVDERKKLGEYYTPIYIAEYVLEQIGFFQHPAPLLDPACGSGTFLIAATVGLIKRLQKKGIKLDIAIKQTLDLVHGLDINVFAAFIAQLQLLWHLLPYIKRTNMVELPELKIYGGMNSLVSSRQTSFYATMLETPFDVRVNIRDSKYQYVVGNPPYIRNERLKDRGKWRDNYQLVDYRNSDIAYFFVTRAIEGRRGALPSWLNDGGRFCFVLPMGLCDSQAASKVREILLKYKILEITDLEDIAIHIFPSPQASGRATVAPVLFFGEKTRDKNSSVDIVQVSEKAVELERLDSQTTITSQIKKNLFQKNKINPHGQFLTKIQTSDTQILQKIMNHKNLSDFCISPTPSYGIKSGKDATLSSISEEGFLPLATGANVSSFCVNENIQSWVDLDTVASKSIWKGSEPEIGFVISEICHVPQCSEINPTKIAFNNSTIVFLPQPEYSHVPWDALINSSIIRFVYLIVLRTALVGVGTSIGNNRRASWSHVYPRTISAVPVSQKFISGSDIISEVNQQLKQIAVSINTRWKNVIQKIESSTKKPLSLFDIDFLNWSFDITGKFTLKVEREDDEWILRPYKAEQRTLLYLKGEYSLLNIIKFLIETQYQKNLLIRDMQNLLIPDNYLVISDLIDEANNPNSRDIMKFRELYEKLDNLIRKAYGLTKKQWKYIQMRLSSQPFDVLEPRWPWTDVKIRKIQQYTEDRFA